MSKSRVKTPTLTNPRVGHPARIQSAGATGVKNTTFNNWEED